MARMSRRRRDGPRLSAVPIVFVIALLLIGTIATTFAMPAATPSPAPDLPVGSLPAFPNVTAPPTEMPLGRYPADAESAVVNSCVSGIDPNTVPAPIADAFCVCTLNKFEQLYPTYDEFQGAIGSGAITDQIKTDISNRCAVQIVGG
ncbi:MAG TPA: hypothetical protein DCK98_12320 [Chloroflexi bacterium]|nr:hypothetical protein [Chloroflexota bacterium]HAL25674.1 hypothetical protein [Chloroflexota bacterium]